jgi:hypothetical protein
VSEQATFAAPDEWPCSRTPSHKKDGRGISLLQALMGEVLFEEGGVVVPMRKSAGQAAAESGTIRNPYREHL